MNVYLLANGLPAEQRARIQQLARAYAEAAIDRDWPQMFNDQIPEGTVQIDADMWNTLMSVKVASPNEITAEDHALYELSSSPSIAGPASCKARPGFPACCGAC